jgi:hypothetical protein
MALETTFKKLASMLLAIALASNVLPVPNRESSIHPAKFIPGGPYKRTPFGGLIPTLMNNSGLVKGSSITLYKLVNKQK